MASGRPRASSYDSIATAIPDIDFDNPQQRAQIFYPAVQSLTNALGGYEQQETTPGSGKYETVYRPGDSILAVLKDLKKLWRKDDSDDERTVARCMYRSGLMRELISILVEMTERGDWGKKVALVACDLIAALTWPIDVAQELKEMADGPAAVTDYASLLRAQQEYKAMLIQTNGPLRSLLALMLPCLAKSRKEEKDERVISLGLHIIRNLLSVKDAVASSTTIGQKEEMSRMQASSLSKKRGGRADSNLISQLHQLTYFQLFLTLASLAEKTDMNQYNVLILDILHLVYRGVRPKDLVRDQARGPMDQLASLLETERKTKALGSKNISTRHSRFGTTIKVQAGDQKLILHRQNAIHADPGKILDQNKKKKAVRVKMMDELTQLSVLDPEAMTILQRFAKEFLKNCFNTFFATILKDIRMERTKIRPSDNIRTFYLSRFFMEYLLRSRRQETEAAAKRKEKGIVEEEPLKRLLPLGLVGEMAEMDSVRWVVMRMKFSMDERPPAWNELQASIDCFTQILLLIDAMAVSDQEEDNEVAEILQHQLYYNGDVLDSSLEVVAKYKDQSVAYLDSVINFAYILLRMLERYSKTKSFMFVRKRKAARKKRKEQAENPEAGATATGGVPDEENEEDIQAERDMPSYAEHAFTFTAFERRFAQENVVNTLLTYLARFQEFEDPDQMKRVVGLMHRQVVRSKAEGLYFRIGSLHLFQKILDERQSLPKADASNDLVQIINYILRKFFKKVAEDPFVIVETLGPKSRNKWKDLSSYKSDEEGEDGMGGQRARIKEKMVSAELEFKKNKKLSWSQQMEIVISLLLGANHKAWIEWVISVLEIAVASREEVVLATDGLVGPRDGEEEEMMERGARPMPSKEAMDKFTPFDLSPDSEEHRAAIASHPHLRLMLTLVSFERTFDEMAEHESWSMPAKILPSHINTSIGALRQYLLEPPSLAEDPKALIQKKRKRRARLTRRDTDPDGEEAPKKQRKRKVAEVQNYKSAAFIDDSDDDEDADLAFFEKERLLREDMMRIAEERAGEVMREMQAAALAKAGSKGKGKKDGKGKGKATVGLDEDEDEEEGEAAEPVNRRERGQSDSDDDSESESPSESESEDEDDLPRRKKSRLPRVRRTPDSDGEGEGYVRDRHMGLSEAIIESDSE